MDKIVEQIRKLLALAGNNPCEKEAISAALKAQSLMAKYSIDMAQVEDESVSKEEITTEACSKGVGMVKWQTRLANIIANNFRVKFYLQGDNIVFYGYRTDVKIAKEVFTFLSKSGAKLATKTYNKARYNGLPTKGIMNSYLMGFVQGVSEILERQCVALMIVTPEEVQQSFSKMTENWRKVSSNIRYNSMSEHYKSGVYDGRSVANSRSIEG